MWSSLKCARGKLKGKIGPNSQQQKKLDRFFPFNLPRAHLRGDHIGYFGNATMMQIISSLIKIVKASKSRLFPKP